MSGIFTSDPLNVPQSLGPDAGAGAGQSVNLFKLVHRMMRGRYLLAAGLAAIGGVAGGYLGWRSQIPKYRSEAWVMIQPVRATLLGRSGQGEVMPMFQSFARNQAALITNDRVLNVAMNSDEWRALSRGTDQVSEQEFRQSVRVVTDYDTPERIMVSFIDRDAKAARIGVEQVTKAYEDIFGQRESRAKNAQLTTLETKRRQLDEEIASRERRIAQETADYGNVDSLDSLNKFHNELLLAVKAQISETEIKLAGLIERPAPTEGEEPPPLKFDDKARAGQLTAEDIAGVDQKMDNYLSRRREIQRELDSMREQGLGDAHRAVRKILQEMAAQDKQIEDYRREFIAGRAGGQENKPIAQRVETVESLQTRLAQLREQEERYSKEAKEIGNKKSLIDSLRQEINFHRTQRDEVVRTIEGLIGDKAVQEAIGTIEVIPPQNNPSVPTVDGRSRFAAVGLCVGAGIPLAAVALLGLVNARYRYSDEATDDSQHGPLLGILPRLPQNLENEEEASAAAHCVHQIRTLLQVNSEGHKIYCVTSSTAGDGKTSLTLSMGLSFAASGVRTLLVDLDLIGQGLSRSLKRRPEEGIGQALTSGQVNPGQIVPVQIENLWLFPTSRSDDRIASRLSQTMVADLLNRLRPEYDVILVDTGPILGSLEANFSCAVADGTILVVGQGQSRSNVRQAFSQLDRLRARTLGFVFNLASQTDFMSSARTASFRSVRRDAPTPPKAPVDFPDLDPLPRTVALDTRR